MVVLVGYKTVKEALVNFADEFGDRDPLHIMDEFNKGHGKADKKIFFPQPFSYSVFCFSMFN